MSRKPLVFMHVPKCAGAAFVKSLIEAVNAKAAMFDKMDRTLFGTFDEFDGLPENLRVRICVDGLTPGAHDFVSGHLAFTSLRNAYPSAPLVTLLREPRIRLVSHYLYCRSLSDSILATWGRWADWIRPAQGCLSEFAGNPGLVSQIDNVFARFLLHPHPLIPAGDYIPEERQDRLYREAADRLEEFDFADLLENPALEGNVERWLGRSFRMIHEHATVPGANDPLVLADDIDPPVLRRIARLTAIDQRLWMHVARQRRAFEEPAEQADRLFDRYVAKQSEAARRRVLAPADVPASPVRVAS